MVAQRAGGRLGVLLLVLLAGCEPGAEPPGGEPPAGPADRPAERSIEVEIEGYREALPFVLYRPPAGFPVPFSTYIPADMVAETHGSETAVEVVFMAAFGGMRNEAAAVRLMVYPPGSAESEAVARLRELAAALGTELVDALPEERFGWSLREFRNVAAPGAGEAAEGVMAIGRRGDRLFSIAIHYPAEYGDGMGPRAHAILGEWRWEGTGEPLLGPETGLNGRA
jgi:hypothetical protein